MSQRGEDLARFREQITTEKMPPWLYWLGVGIGVGQALDLIVTSEISRPWWQSILIAVPSCALLGLISGIVVWVAWLLVLSPLWMFVIGPLWKLVNRWLNKWSDRREARLFERQQSDDSTE